VSRYFSPPPSGRCEGRTRKSSLIAGFRSQCRRQLSARPSRSRGLSHPSFSLMACHSPSSSRTFMAISKRQLAEGQGFEPWDRFRDHTLSRRARSTTPAPLQFTAESQGFEPWVGVSDSGFQGRCIRPLCQLSSGGSAQHPVRDLSALPHSSKGYLPP
jgi:hypothetical protein